ncbi:outer membrane protein assembly factor [Geomonas limicola]|uniref:Translocation and assembly module subunit TamA n=1 Tax=Geomonas limicola TaxID=2740186 RepID=A0A6V8NCX7_9BACT|nr:autotransporter assembly complex family protein [Geomonas limicola]GFO70492.1 outer membrane protein assembly factor [Geomonas limicola]
MFRFAKLPLIVCSLVLLLGVVGPACAADPLELEVTGVEGEALKNVQQALALPPGLVRDGKVDRLWLDRFAGRAAEQARQALEPFGYYHAVVGVSVEEDRGRGRYRLLVRVAPGTPVRVSQVEVGVTGPGAGTSELVGLSRAFPLAKGDILLQPEYDRAKGGLKATAVSLGYLDADFTRHEIRISPGEVEARIALTLETGPRYYFDGVSIEGAQDYPEEYLRRFVTFKEGEVFSNAKLAETQLNFTNSERFKQVVVNPQKEQARDHKVPVQVVLAPAPRRSIRPGVGYGTDTGARFTVRFRDLNLFHLGHDLDLNLYAAQRLQGFAGRYTIPSPRDIKTSTVFQLNLQQEDVGTYQSKLVAVEVDRNRSFKRGELGTAYVKVQEERFTIGAQDSTSRLVLPGFRFSKEYFDNLVRPRRGYRYMVDLRGAHPALGSDSALAQAIVEGNALLPLPWRLALQLRSRLGGTLLADPLGDVPPSIRFFAGGDESVRGYSYQSLGPRDATGQVVGGRHLIFASAELQRYLFENWGVSTFFDTGNAFSDLNRIKLYQALGVGVHYYTPVGGLNLSLAHPLDSGWTRYRIVFTVGFQL